MLKAHKLYDAIKQEFDLKSDAALGKLLGISLPAISKVRNGHHNVGGDTILAVYDKTGWSIEKIRSYL